MWKVNGAEVQCKVAVVNGNGGMGGMGGMGQMGQMGQAGGLGQVNIGPGGVGGMMGGGMGMGGGMDQRRPPMGDLGMVQDGTKCGENMVKRERDSSVWR